MIVSAPIASRGEIAWWIARMVPRGLVCAGTLNAPIPERVKFGVFRM
jgi:hypothetical protein